MGRGKAANHQRKTKSWENIPRNEFAQRLEDLLNEPLWQYQKEFWGFRKALEKKKEYIFKFLYDPDVPYDNNDSYPNFLVIQNHLLQSLDNAQIMDLKFG